MKQTFSILLIGFLACSLQLTSRAQSVATQKADSAAQQEKIHLIDQLWEKSDAAFHEGDYPLAIDFHQQIVTLDPHDVESYSVAAWLMWSMGNGDQAQQHIDRGLKANPENWEMWDAAGQQDSLQKYFSKAEFAFSQAVKFLPAKNDSQLLRRRWAHAAEDAGNVMTAIEIWQKLVKDYPDEVVNANNLNRLLNAKPAAPAKPNLKEAVLWPVKVLLAQLGLYSVTPANSFLSR